MARKQKKIKASNTTKIKKTKVAKLAKAKSNGVGRPKGHSVDSIESKAPWEKKGISRRTWYRHQLLTK